MQDSRTSKQQSLETTDRNTASLGSNFCVEPSLRYEFNGRYPGELRIARASVLPMLRVELRVKEEQGRALPRLA